MTTTASADRRLYLQSCRTALQQLPVNEYFEIPGRPNVLYLLREYSSVESGGASQCREDVPFLFKAFETGQIGPKRLAKLHGGKAKVRTIHEYLDWTVTESNSVDEDELVSGAPEQLWYRSLLCQVATHMHADKHLWDGFLVI